MSYPNSAFHDWYVSMTVKHGSLLCPAHAARMAGISRQYLERLVKTGRLNKFYYEDMPFVSKNELDSLVMSRVLKGKKI